MKCIRIYVNNQVLTKSVVKKSVNILGAQKCHGITKLNDIGIKI